MRNTSTQIAPAPSIKTQTNAAPAPTLLTDAEQQLFWRLYAKTAQPAIERACRTLARSATGNAMCAEDMIAWVDDRVWRMIRLGKWPIFHDHPTPAEAADRLTQKAKLFARWAYLGLSRSTFRRKSREAALLSGMSRAERLAAVSSTPVDADRLDQVNRDLEEIRAKVSPRVRAQLAASWPEADERRHVAAALGATGPQEDALIQRVENGEIKSNTVDQMRSRSRKDIREALKKVGGRTMLMVLCAVGLFLFAATPAKAGEQTGGRPHRAQFTTQALNHGEQTGGRPG